MFLSKKFTAAFVLAITGIAIGGPLLRREDWTNPDGGSADIHVSDNKIAWGTVDPQDAIGQLGQHCHSDGTCDGEFSIDTTWVVNKPLQPTQEGKIKLEMKDAQFEVWAKNGIVKSLQKTMSDIQSVDHTSYTNPASCVGSICSTNDPVDIDQFMGPQQMNIQIRSDDGGLKDFIHVIVTAEVDKSDSGACSVLVGMGAGLAGAVSGFFGSAVGLGSLACLISDA